MKYDFYMFNATPVELQRKYSRVLPAFDTEEQAGEPIALFRDPQVVEAIAGASDEVRDCFLDAGFGLMSYDQGIRGGGFPVEDAGARGEVLSRLRAGLAKLPLVTDWNGFDLDEFLAVAEAAQQVKRERKGLAMARRKILPVLRLEMAQRIKSRVVSRVLSRSASGF